MSKKNQGKHLSFRLNILFLITFVLFSALIFRLSMLQIVQGEEYLQETEKNMTRKISAEAPRGWMMDRNGEVLVRNKSVRTITYTENSSFQQDREKIATKLAELIDEDAQEILAKMEGGTSLTPQRIAIDISLEEWFKVAEHLHDLPGVDVMLDSIREYPHENTFRTFLGSVRGIPEDRVGYYLSKGYSMNELVGTSFLELQYEDQLKGKKEVTEIMVDKSLRPVGEAVIDPGHIGNSLALSIDLNLQKKIEEVIDTTFENRDESITKDALHERPLFVAMDPHTGEVLGMSNNVYTIGVGASSYVPGSIVKMATVLMGLHEGIVTPTTQIRDAPLTLPDGRQKRSWQNLGTVNALTAISRSSNIYMINIGFRMANFNGSYYDRDTFEDIFYYFSQFGLGVKTGIDLPNEGEGKRAHPDDQYSTNPFRRDQFTLGVLADYTFGQRDEYTPIQLAQYVSTIANGGYRIQPHLVREIKKGVPTDDDFGQVIYKKEPTVLNRIEMSDEHIELVQRGMEMTTEPGGTAYSMFGSFPVKVAAKTGTAQTERQVTRNNRSFTVNHTTFVGYAPADNPQIAFICIAPYSGSSSHAVPATAQTITRQILEYYFDLVSEEELAEEGTEDEEMENENAEDQEV